MREYALERLAAAGDERELRARHARALRDLMTRAEDEPAGPQRERLAVLAIQDMDNAREAFHWPCATIGRPPWRCRPIARPLTTFTAWRREVFDWMQACEASIDETIALPLRVLWWRHFRAPAALPREPPCRRSGAARHRTRARGAGRPGAVLGPARRGALAMAAAAAGCGLGRGDDAAVRSPSGLARPDARTGGRHTGPPVPRLRRPRGRADAPDGGTGAGARAPA